jgi:hypothetical protein
MVKAAKKNARKQSRPVETEPSSAEASLQPSQDEEDSEKKVSGNSDIGPSSSEAFEGTYVPNDGSDPERPVRVYADGEHALFRTQSEEQGKVHIFCCCIVV